MTLGIVFAAVRAVVDGLRSSRQLPWKIHSLQELHR
jgi:hypothetical protein